LAADVVLFVHLAFVLYVVLLMALVPIGARFGWRWVRLRLLRIAHLGAIAFVAGEAITGVVCPLTAWEALLRGRADSLPFVPRLVHAALYYDLSPWVFTSAYAAAAVWTAALWWLVPPRGRR
jgi:hypothetical protein